MASHPAQAGGRTVAPLPSAPIVRAMLTGTLDLGTAKPRRQTRVVVAMSGGVDSSVTSALLVEAGYEVVGITLQLYAAGGSRSRPGACCAGEDIYDARRVADRLGIRHYVLDYEARFKEPR